MLRSRNRLNGFPSCCLESVTITRPKPGVNETSALFLFEALELYEAQLAGLYRLPAIDHFRGDAINRDIDGSTPGVQLSCTDGWSQRRISFSD